MNNTEILAVEKKFFILAEGVETPESIYPQESASDYFKSVWQKQNEIARQAFKKIVKDSSHRPHVCDAIVQTIVDLNNPNFDDFCFDVSQKGYCPETVDIIIKNCLILRNNHKSILKIDKTIRDGCQLFLNNKLNEGDICELVRHAAILERNHLSHDILNMVQSVNANNFPYIHITLLKPVEIIAHGMAENGDIYLRTILEDNSSCDYEQVAAVFGLACKRQLSHFNYFQKLFWRFYEQRNKTDVCRELIEAIVYTTSCYDNSRFLQDSLPIVRKDIEKHSNFLSFFHKRHYSSIGQKLLEASAYLSKQTPSLQNELKNWLTINHKFIQIYAILALENYSYYDQGLEKKWQDELKAERNHRRNPSANLIRLKNVFGVVEKK